MIKIPTDHMSYSGKEADCPDADISRLLNTLPGMAYRCRFNENWTMEYLSRGCKDLTGYDTDDLINDKRIPYSKIVHPEDIEKVKNDIAKACREKRYFEVEYRIQTKDKKIKWVWERGRCMLSPDNEVMCLEGYIEDISQRKESELSLRESEKKYHDLLDFLPDAVVLLNMRGKIISVNKAFLEMSGYFEEDFINKHIFQIPTRIETNLKGYLKLLDHLLKHETDKKIFFRWKHRSGRICLGEARVCLIRTNRETYLMGVFRDITDLRDTQKELFLSKIRAETILHSLPDIMFVMDASGRILDYKCDFCDLYYQDESGIIDKNIYDLLPEEVSRLTLENIRLTFKTGKMQVYYYDLEIPEKGLHHYEARMIKSSKEEVTVIIRDISEQKNMELKLIESKEKAEEGNRLKAAFLANMSHEIRTPINAISGFSALLLKTIKDEHAVKYLNLIRGSADRLLHVIEDVLLYSRLQSEKVPVYHKSLDVGNMIKDLHETFSLMREDRTVSLKTSVAEECRTLKILADYDKIWQVMSNLISNAVKYTTEGGIIIGSSIENGNILFFVKDTGIGIGEHEREKIFERFVRGESVRDSKAGGTGLGLSIARELVELMGGRIGLISEAEKGSHFYFSIPLIVDPASESKSSPDVNNNCNISKFVVLIAEDESSNFMYLNELMKDRVARIDHAVNGKEALELVEKNTYDLILMDIKMPVISGLEATKIIRKKYPDIPIIAQTAYAQHEEIEIILEAGADGYLTKPIFENDLLKTIDTVCRKYKQTGK